MRQIVRKGSFRRKKVSPSGKLVKLNRSMVDFRSRRWDWYFRRKVGIIFHATSNLGPLVHVNVVRFSRPSPSFSLFHSPLATLLPPPGWKRVTIIANPNKFTRSKREFIAYVRPSRSGVRKVHPGDRLPR